MFDRCIYSFESFLLYISVLSASPVFTNMNVTFEDSAHSLSRLNSTNSSFLDFDANRLTQASSRRLLNNSASHDIKRFTSRLSSHMSTISDGLPFSDIEDVDDLDQLTEKCNSSFTDKGSTTKSFKMCKNRHATVGDKVLSQSEARSCTPPPSMLQQTNHLEAAQSVTPLKPIPQEGDPVTPTANLKLLLCAVSPDIRNLEQQRLNETCEFSVDDVASDDNFEHDSPVDPQLGDIFSSTSAKSGKQKSKRLRRLPRKLAEDIVKISKRPTEASTILSPNVSRKDKSLGLLCQRYKCMGSASTHYIC